MTVDEYLTRLIRYATETRLRPVAPVEMISLELHLKRPLPASYERFLTLVGCGRDEHGSWLHVDPTLSGNIIELREHVAIRIGKHRCSSRCRAPHCARDLYPIYEAGDGTLYGFVRYGSQGEGGFKSAVYALKPGHISVTPVSESFDGFLDQLVGGPSESPSGKQCASVASRYGRTDAERGEPARAAA